MKIRILHIVFSLAPGGMENGVVNVATRLPVEDFHVDVCCLEERGAFADRLPESSDVVVLNKPPGKSVATIWKLLRVIRRLKPDIVHTHDLGPLIYGGLSTLGGRLAKLVHGEHRQFSDDELTPERLKQRRRFYKWCRQIHTVSASLSEHVSSLGLTDQGIRSLVNGVDSDRFSPADKTASKVALGIPPDARVIGVVGRLVPHKRHAAVIDAFEDMDGGEQAFLLLVGDGECLEALEEKRQTSPLRDRILINGFMPNPEIAYRAMDILVLPSLLEGLSNALLEAMACGVPCLAHSACGCAEAIDNGSTGFVLDLSTTDALKKALVHAMASDLGAFGMRARQAALNEFSITAMVNAYADFYRQTMGMGH